MKKTLLILLTLAFSAQLTLAGGIPFTQTVQGSIAAVQTNVDGLEGTASIGSFHGTSSIGGTISIQTVTELSAVPGGGAPCAPGEVEFPLVAFSAVERLDAAGALLYFTLDPVAGGFSCANPITGALSGSANFLLIGGTGPLTGVSGTATLTFSGATIAVDSLGNAVQTALTGSIAGTLVLP